MPSWRPRPRRSAGSSRLVRPSGSVSPSRLFRRRPAIRSISSSTSSATSSDRLAAAPTLPKVSRPSSTSAPPSSPDDKHHAGRRAGPNDLAKKKQRKHMEDLSPRSGDLEPIETASRDEISALQLTRLKTTLAHAYGNSPHYRAQFDKAGVRPGDLRTLSDLSKFPFTVKKDLRDTYPFGMFAVPRERIARIYASSGTTGKPTVVGYTHNDIEIWASCVARSIRAAGGRAGDICHVAYGYGLFTGGLGAHYGAEKLGCTVIPVSGGLTERQVSLIHDFKPRIIMVTPSYMLSILEEFRRQGLDPRRSSLAVGIFGAEPWTNAMRAEIEARA